MTRRRTFLKQVAGITALSLAGGTAAGQCDCTMCNTVPEREGEAALSGPPDFTIESDEKTHHVYWKSRDHFAEKFSAMSLGYAAIEGNYIALNSAWSQSIDTSVVAHELGHNLGYEHEDGTLMDPTMGDMADKQPSEPLSDVTREILERMDGAVVCHWNDENGREQVQNLVERYFDGEVSRSAVGYAVRQYFGSCPNDAYFLTDWDNFGDGSDGVSESGQFYRV